MSAFVLIDIKVENKDPYLQYITQARPIVESYGGRYLIRGGEVTPLFGDWIPQRIVVIEFPSRDAAENCFGSPDYREIAHLRENSTVTRAIIVEGHLKPRLLT
jgi:uncharacterized protein (DUF1330 family)